MRWGPGDIILLPIVFCLFVFCLYVIIHYIVILNALFNVVCSQVAVCNLASIALNMYVTPERTFDFKKLASVTKVIVRNLNKIIDINYYPVPEVCFLLWYFFSVDHTAYVLCVNKWLLSPALQAERSNMRHRPIGIGVQGLADAFILMRYPFESPEAQLLNIQIFETIYYAALEASCELAAKLGTYETYAGSPVSKGVSRFYNVSNPSWDSVYQVKLIQNTLFQGTCSSCTRTQTSQHVKTCQCLG